MVRYQITILFSVKECITKEDKMNIKMLKAAVAGLVLAVSGFANAGLITFDDHAVGSIITDQYLSDGVVFSGWENGVEVNLTTSNVYSPTYGIYLGNSDSGTAFPGNRWDEIRMDFISGVDNLSFKLYSHGSNSITFNAYDISNAIIETIVMSSGPWGNVNFSSTNITRVSALQPDDNWYWAMDEVSFSPTASVPEPSTLAIFALGIMGLASRRL